MAVEIELPGPPVGTIGAQNGAISVVPAAGTPVSATAAVNTQVQITINISAGQTIRLVHLSGSYSAAPTAGVLTIVVNAVTIFQADIIAGGQFTFHLPAGGLQCATSQSAVITLTAAGAAVAGRLNVASYTGP